MKALYKYGLSTAQLFCLGLFLTVGLFGHLLTQEQSADHLRLIPYSASSIDKANRNVSPLGSQDVSSLRYRHWLGTDPIGRDVLAGIISGTNVAVRVGFFTVLLSLIIGFIFGYLSGYLGDIGFKLSRLDLLLLTIIMLLSIFYIIYGQGLLRLAAILVLIATIIFASHRSDTNLSNGVHIPFDLIIMRILELFKSIPGLFFILVLLTIFKKPSIMSVVIVIVAVRWPSITRYLRAEILKIKEQDYVIADRALGLPEWRIFTHTVLPMAISPVLIISAFGFASAILLESTLSFLGIGVPPDVVTWGSLLNLARNNFSSWWLAFFPGLMIYGVIFLFNSIGDRMDARLRGRKKE